MQNRPGRGVPARPDTLGAALSRAIVRWLGLPGIAAPIPSARPARRDPSPPQPAAPAAAATRPANARSSAAVAQAPGAGLVEGLIANPRSLAAGFIAAEILGPPVALRRP